MAGGGLRGTGRTRWRGAQRAGPAPGFRGDLTGSWDEKEREAFADRLETQIARITPGWRELIMARRITSPDQFEAGDANLVGGALNGGTTAVHQQLIFRPTPGPGRPETPIAGLYLA